ncbi:serine/threonine-protein kinase ULK4-like isoform X3 [Acanthaster planci]|uniref:Serine/threonine-protein kinase ULK4-like isoform X3 n=1 Tax=Acanthaster planci TaxID=133434 RepID=A0A8B7XQK7_ACAPL|nr:serine/threonine-protein kinase ULK4-like isoform X3 [Acanthaster planci]
MENFILYDEIYRDEHSIVYKGRRKGSINFVAIHCMDKARRPQVTNRVRLTHELDHPNVVQFYEWYETTNHLWLVVELCTGGCLKHLLLQDEHLPESSIRRFGLDVVRGLHYLHSLGVLFSDLQPSKILLDGTGILKFDDFSLSRVEGEDLDEVFESTLGEDCGSSADSSDQGNEDTTKQRKTLGSPSYLAPELLEGQTHSMASDLWSLGCLLHEMYTGKPPFTADTFPELVEKVLHNSFAQPRIKGPRISSKPSPDFCSLLEGLLKKDPSERMDWHNLVAHPFWQGDLLMDKDKGDNAPPEGGETQKETAKSSVDMLTETPSNIKQYNLISISPDGRPISRSGTSSQHHLLRTSLQSSGLQTFRPQSTPEASDTSAKEAQFTISSRPQTSPVVSYETSTDPKETKPHPPRKSSGRKKSATKESKTGGGMGDGKQRIKYHRDRQISMEDEGSKVELVFTLWDLTVSPIIDNAKIQKPAPLKYDIKNLPVAVPALEKLLKFSRPDLLHQLDGLADALGKMNDKTASGQRSKVQFLNYIATVCSNGTLGAVVIKSNLILSLLQCLKANQALEVRCRAGRVLGLLALNMEELEEDVQLTEVFTALTEVIRDNTRNSKLKQGMLPALGELLFLVATQEEQKGCSVEAWTVPAITYTMLARCIREGEDSIVQHNAAKSIENVYSTMGTHSQKLATSETGHILWHLFNHSTADALKITAISALCRLTRQSVSIFQSVIDKVGLPNVLEALAVNITKVQQALATMFAALLMEGTHIQRLVQDKSAEDFILRIMKLLDSPSMLIRAKAVLVLLEVTNTNMDMIHVACQARLVMYIERDSRRQQTGGNQGQASYLSKCLDLITNYLVDIVPQILGDAISSLNAVAGRKHPSSIQAKQLKTSLPLVPVALHLVTSQIFRTRIIGEKFLEDIGDLLAHVQSLDSGDTSIEPAIGTTDFIKTVLSILEAVAQHPCILMEYHSVIIENILPALASLVSSDNGDTRIFCLRLFAEITSLYLTHDQLTEEHPLTNPKLLEEIIGDRFLPHAEQILLDPDPVPVYGLKLLLALIEKSPAYIKRVEELDLYPVFFQVLLDHQNAPISSAIRNLVGIFHCLVSHKDTNMKALYDQGTVDHLCNLLQQSVNIYMDSNDNTDTKSVQLLLTSLQDTILVLLKYVAAVVRQVLQAKKSGVEADTQGAESLLLNNKPFVEVTACFMQLICSKERDIKHTACECLSLIAQLFGGEYKDTMSLDNMDCLAVALPKSDAKRQKLLLRFIKRVISTEKQHADMLREQGQGLCAALQNMVQTASSHADVAVSSLAADVLKTAGVKVS